MFVYTSLNVLRMFCLLKNSIVFFSNSNFFFFNFFFLKNFNYMFYFNYNLKNFNKKILSNTSSEFKFKKNFFLKFISYTNVGFRSNYSVNINQNKVDFLHKSSVSNIYLFNKLIYKSHNLFLNSIFLLSKNNLNFLFLDDNYRNLLPLYNYIYSEKNLFVFKKFFFATPKYFTFSNWSYHYKKFAKRFNVTMVIVLNYNSFKKFFKFFNNLNLPISSLVHISQTDCFVDYPIFYNSSNINFEKFIFFNIISTIYLSASFYKSYYLKKKYLSIFYNFQNFNKNLI